MDETCYLISDASKKVDVETHVLRYWEEELGLAIPRNEMGHRYYTEFHIRLFCQVKKLKDRGYQLKAIKNAMKQIMVQNQGIAETARVLENDIARTLQENQRFRFTCRFASDKPIKKEKEEESEKERQKNEYREGERQENKRQENECQENEFFNISHLADYNRLEERSSIKTMKTEETVKASAAAINSEKNNQIIREKEEKDGRTDMKNKGKNRKKPSAWERRNGVVAGRREMADEKAGNKESGEQLAEELAEKESAAGRIAEEENQEIMVKDEITNEITSETTYGITNDEIIDENMMAEEEIITENVAALSSEQIASKNADALSSKQITSKNAAILSSEQTDVRNKAVWSEQTQTVAENETNQADQTVGKKQVTAVALRSGAEEVSSEVMSPEEKIMQFQKIMNHIIGKALEANSEKLSLEISRKIHENIAEEMAYQLQICDEREEARYRHLDEAIRSCQRENQVMAEAAAARMPFFRRKRFEQKGNLT